MADESPEQPPFPPVPPSAPPPAVATAPTTSGLAIASLVLGLVWIGGIGSVMALVFGVIAKGKIRNSNGWVTGGGMATAGIILGIVGAVAAVLFWIWSTGDPYTEDSIYNN